MTNSLRHDQKEIKQDNTILRFLAVLMVITAFAYAGYAGWLAYHNTGYNSYGSAPMATFSG